MPSELGQKNLELHFHQLEYDCFAKKYKIQVAGDKEKRERLRSEKISKLIGKGLCLDPDTDSLYKGYRSINCKNCVLGRTQGIYVTDDCSRNCFFCPQQRVSQPQHVGRQRSYTPTAEEDRELLDAVISNDSTGCGLTGGEPLVVFYKTLHYIRLLKEHMGKEFWLHLYTNGDNLDRATLQELKEAGLDEIRFNLAAVDYDLEKVALSKKYVPKVVIEIPVIPEDAERLQQMMFGLEGVGIDCLNLHEMAIYPANIEKMRRRGYTAARPVYQAPFYLMMDSAPVSGSEELILDLIDLALTEQFSYGIHYCHYKARILKQNLLKHYHVARKVCRPYERVSEEGLLEKLVVPESGMDKAIADLKRHRVPEEKIYQSISKKRLETDMDYLEFLNPKQYEVAIVKTLPEGFFNDLSIKIIKQ
jgi:pyruvate formate-lyase activating enzyme-like uncharacterized protein